MNHGMLHLVVIFVRAAMQPASRREWVHRLILGATPRALVLARRAAGRLTKSESAVVGAW